MLKNGIYYIPACDKIILMQRVQNYEDMTSEFSIITWEEEHILKHRVLITSDQYKRFKYMGEL